MTILRDKINLTSAVTSRASYDVWRSCWPGVGPGWFCGEVCGVFTLQCWADVVKHCG